MKHLKSFESFGQDEVFWKDRTVEINGGEVVKIHDRVWWDYNDGEPIEVEIDTIDPSKGANFVFVNEIQGDEATRDSVWVNPADLYASYEDIAGGGDDNEDLINGSPEPTPTDEPIM